MLTFREITPQDRELVLPMVYDFYRSDAVDHPVDAAILEQSFQDAAGWLPVHHSVLLRRGGGAMHLP